MYGKEAVSDLDDQTNQVQIWELLWDLLDSLA